MVERFAGPAHPGLRTLAGGLQHHCRVLSGVFAASRYAVPTLRVPASLAARRTKVRPSSEGGPPNDGLKRTKPTQATELRRLTQCSTYYGAMSGNQSTVTGDARGGKILV